MKVLVVNSGSSSLKAQLMETSNGKVLAKAYCQRIGLNNPFMEYKTTEKQNIEAPMPTHKEAFQLVLNSLLDKKLGVIKSLEEIKAILNGVHSQNIGVCLDT